MIVYKITNLTDGSSYIGKTVKSLAARWSNHLSDASAGAPYYLHRAIRKYGKDCFSCEVICECATEEELNFWEKFCIDVFKTKSPYGYNMTDGGDGQSGRKLSAESRAKISSAQLGRYIPERHREIVRRALTGLKRSPDFCKAIGDRFRGKPKTQDQKNKLSVSVKALWSDPAYRERICSKLRGRLQLHLAKLTTQQVSEIKKLLAQGGVSQAAISRQFGVSRTTIANIVSGKTWAGVEA